MSPKRIAPETVCTSRDIRNPEYAVSSVSTPIAAVPGSHPNLQAHVSQRIKTELLAWNVATLARQLCRLHVMYRKTHVVLDAIQVRSIEKLLFLGVRRASMNMLTWHKQQA